MAKLFAFAPLFAAALAASAPAQAETVSRPVSYADLDLGSPQGQSALAARLRSAVRSVCPRDLNESALEAMKRRDCRRVAIARARNDGEVAIAAVAERRSVRLAANR